MINWQAVAASSRTVSWGKERETVGVVLDERLTSFRAWHFFPETNRDKSPEKKMMQVGI